MRGGLRKSARGFAALLTLALLLGSGPAQTAAADPVTTAPPITISISQRSTMAILTWPAVDSAAGYAVDLDANPMFTAPVRTTSTSTVSVLTGLIPETSYYVHLATFDPATGAVGDWGVAQTFTTTAQEYAASAPVVKLSSLASTSITADWTEPEPGLTYQVTLGRKAREVTETKLASQSSVTFNKLERATKYFVNVRALDTGGNPVTAWSGPSAIETADSQPLRVGSYNILCENCSGGKASWAERRGRLVADIIDQDLDVLGVQEASIGRIPGGGTQYRDLANRLGKPYLLTEAGRGVSPDIRVLYNSARLTMLKHGILALPRGASRRFLSWAVFEQKSTGKQFFFSNTHLEPADGRKAWGTRRTQAKAIVSATDRLNGKLPVIAVGDYASTKWEKGGNAPYDVMQAAGYRDPLGNAYRSHNSAPGAFVEKRINTDFASLNMYERKARRWASDVNGSNTDYIFTSEMRVSEYEVVVKVDSAGRFIGVIPSDHNLIRATVYLP